MARAVPDPERAESDGQGRGSSPVEDAAVEFLNHLQVEKGASPNTLASYSRVLRKYLQHLERSGVATPSQIGREQVVEFAGSLGADGLSARSLAASFSVVRSFHRFMVSEGAASEDPSSVLVSPRTPSRLPRALTRGQVEELLGAPGGDDARDARDRFMLEMLYATGIRISELVGLDVGDIDLERKVLTVHGKGGRWRVVPFGGAAAESAQFYLDESRPLLARGKHPRALVLNARGGRLTRQGCWKIIKQHARSVGLQDSVTPHVLRHSCATHLLEGGASLPVVQQLLGHVSISTTQIYTEVSRDHLREVYRRAHPRS